LLSICHASVTFGGWQASINRTPAQNFKGTAEITAIRFSQPAGLLLSDQPGADMLMFSESTESNARATRWRLRGLMAIAASIVLTACGGGGGQAADASLSSQSPSSAAVVANTAKAQVRTVNALDDAAEATLSAGASSINQASTDAPVSDFADMPTNAALSLAVSPELAGDAAVAQKGAVSGSSSNSVSKGSSSAISVPMEASPGEQVTVFATGDSSSATTLTFKQKASDVAAGQTGVRVLHAASSVPAVDIYVSAPDAALPATPTIAALGYTSFAPKIGDASLKVPAGDYQIRITLAGKTDVVFDSGKVALPGGQDVLVVAIPSFSAGSVVNLLLLPSSSKPVIIKEPRTSVRAVHLSADAPAVDVLLNDKRVVRKLAFRSDSSFVHAAAGKLNIKVNVADTSTSAITADVDLPANKAVSVIALNKLAAIEPAVIVDDGKQPAAGASKLRVLHAAAGVPGVDVYLTAPDDALPADAAIKGLDFKKSAPASGEAALAVPAGDYRVRLTLAGKKNVVYDSGKFTIKAREDLLVAAVLPKAGDPTQPSPVDLLVVRTRGGNSLLKSKDATEPPPPAGSVRLRAVHASPDAPAVDVLIDDVKAIDALSFGNLSAYKTTSEGTRKVKINVAGTATTALAAELALAKDATYSVVAYDAASVLKALLLKDEAQANPFVGARGYIRIVNLISDVSGTPVFTGSSSGGAAFGNAAPYGESSPGSKSIDVKYTTSSGTGQGSASVGFQLEQGNFYTVYAVGSADTRKGKPVRLIVSRDSQP
jgi:hypothetical protein